MPYVHVMFHAFSSSPYGVKVAISLFAGYFLGSVPFGLIAARLGGAGDIRAIGSGSIGATNVLRTGRWGLALTTLIGDAGKGAAAALAAGALGGPTFAALAGGAAFVGHIFPVWLGFKGGKGVATFYGVLFAIAWPVGLAAGATWLAVAAIFRISSLAGLTAAALAPVYLLAFGGAQVATILLLVGMAVLIFVRHRGNIERLVRGVEPRIGASKAPSA